MLNYRVLMLQQNYCCRYYHWEYWSHHLLTPQKLVKEVEEVEEEVVLLAGFE